MASRFETHQLGELLRKATVDVSRRTFVRTKNFRAVLSPQPRSDGVWLSVHIHPERQDAPWPLLPCAIRIDGTDVLAEVSPSGRALLGPVPIGGRRLRAHTAVSAVIRPDWSAASVPPEHAARMPDDRARQWTRQERLAAAGPRPAPPLPIVDEPSAVPALRITVANDRDGLILVRLASNELALQDSMVRVLVGDVQRQCRLERISEDQVLGQVSFSPDELPVSGFERSVVRVELVDGGLG